MTTIIKKPQDIAAVVIRGAESERYEIIEKNQKRAEYFQEPLPVPAWNLKRMLENINKLTEMTFAQPHFQGYANDHPWDGKSSSTEWESIATMTLRDTYLVVIANNDADLLQQMCEIWPEMTPDPTLTKEQRIKLANLQKQADDIVKRIKGLVTDFMKLAEKEKDIVRGTQSKYDTRIADQTNYIHVNTQYYKENTNKW